MGLTETGWRMEGIIVHKGYDTVMSNKSAVRPLHVFGEVQLHAPVRLKNKVTQE